MNRILQADVILTLTAEEARAVLSALQEKAEFSRAFCPPLVEKCEQVFAVVIEQCAKQGVKL